MLYQTLLQPKIFFSLMLIGFASGFVFDISAYIIFICKKNKVVKIVFDFLATLSVFVIFFLSVLTLDYGEIRLYHVITFFGFLTLQRNTLGKLIAKIFDRCYNLFVKFFELLRKGLQKIKWKKTKHKEQ